MKKIVVVLLLCTAYELVCSNKELINSKKDFVAFQKDLQWKMKHNLIVMAEYSNYDITNADMRIDVKLTHFNRAELTFKYTITGKFAAHVPEYCGHAKYPEKFIRTVQVPEQLFNELQPAGIFL